MECGVLRNQIPRELTYRPLQFHKRGQLFIGAHDESLSVTVRVNDPDVGADAFDSYRWPCTFAM
jgi:GTP cyclohydrolase II